MAGEVLGQAADHLGQDEADDHGAEAAPADVGDETAWRGTWSSVAHVDEAEGADADDGEDAGGEEAAVDRLEGVGLALLGLHGVHAEDRGEHADGAGGQREDEAEGRVGADGA